MALQNKPYATEYYNRFVIAGKGVSSKPDGISDDFIDKYHYYHHVTGNRRWSAGVPRAIGFKINSGKPWLIQHEDVF